MFVFLTDANYKPHIRDVSLNHLKSVSFYRKHGMVGVVE